MYSLVSLLSGIYPVPAMHSVEDVEHAIPKAKSVINQNA